MSGTLLVGQSGGATAVINASLAGVVHAAQRTGGHDRILGMHNGIEGALHGRFLDLTSLTEVQLSALSRTPSAALGTGRYKLRDTDIPALFDRLAAERVRTLVYIGGNDSADTSHRLHHHAQASGYDLQVIAVPKTIDNDLVGTDSCPGYGSIARYLANATRDATFDTLASPQLYPVKFFDVMGRDAGWLPATCALGFDDANADLRPLLYLPERPPVDTDAVLADIDHAVRERGWVVAVLPETLRDASHRHLGGDTPDFVDHFGHPYFPSPAAAMTRLVTEKLGFRARFDRPGTAARMSISLASAVDLEDAERLGAAAVGRAANGASDIMVGLRRVADSPYQSDIIAVPLAEVANRVRPFPDRFIGSDGHSVTDAFRAYALPLLGPDPFPTYLRLR